MHVIIDELVAASDECLIEWFEGASHYFTVLGRLTLICRERSLSIVTPEGRECLYVDLEGKLFEAVFRCRLKGQLPQSEELESEVVSIIDERRNDGI